MRDGSGERVLLFFKDYETDRFFRNDRYLKRAIRPLYNALHRTQKISGFKMWFLLLVKALERQGCDVVINDRDAARRSPAQPVGLVGYPHLIDDWDLPNPALLGPAMFDHPKLAPADLMLRPQNRHYVIVADWMRAMFEPYYGAACVPWFAGIDTDGWPNTKGAAKSVDVLIYDKIRWGHDGFARTFIEPLREALRAKGLSSETIRYGQYDHASYRDALTRSRSMLFLCEHETQGLACQEAMASNVPILAWDFGYWLDPRWPALEDHLVPASSVPFFAPICGMRFRTAAEFPAILDSFWHRLDSFAPRSFVQEELSMEKSGELYLSHYRSLMSVS